MKFEKNLTNSHFSKQTINISTRFGPFRYQQKLTAQPKIYPQTWKILRYNGQFFENFYSSHSWVSIFKCEKQTFALQEKVNFYSSSQLFKIIPSNDGIFLYVSGLAKGCWQICKNSEFLLEQSFLNFEDANALFEKTEI